MLRRLVTLVGILVICLAPLGSQDAQKAPAALPRGYTTLLLGMNFQAFVKALEANASFTWRGLPDVSLTPDGEDKVIESDGGYYIKRGIFQFNQEKLFAIILDFNPAQIDYFMLLSNLSERYGPPKTLDNRRVIWENEQVRLSLERPLTLKYLDRVLIDRRLNNSGVERATQEENRESFLNRL